jgi:pimeloyl-ACP methyl ester carboxylesterase
VLVGEQDAVFLPAADELAAGIPGARRLTIPDAAHSPQHENADAWFEAVRSHLLAVRG